MSIAKFSIQQPVLVNLFMIFIIIAGLFSFNSISKEEFPEISLNAVTIITTYPGVSPEEIEELITKPIEEEVANVDDIDNITSFSSEGRSLITVSFKIEAGDLYRKKQEVQTEVELLAKWHYPRKVPLRVLREQLIRLMINQFIIISSDDVLTTDDLSDPEIFHILIRFEVFTLEEPHNFTLYLKKDHDGDKTIIDSVHYLPAAGWHHIDVTRNTTGWFSVYHNGSPIMEGKDTDIDTSELFWLQFEEWQMIDNVVVSDTIDITPTTTPPPFDWLPIGIGVSAVVIIAVLVIILKRR